MNRYGVSRSLLVTVGVVVGCAVAFYAGTVVRNYLGAGVPTVYAEALAATEVPESVPEVVAERLWVNNEEQGVLKVGVDELLSIQTSASGLTGYERAMIVAKRMNDALLAGITPGEVQSVQEAGIWVVKVADKALITVNPEEADRAGLSRAQLAERWANEITVGLLLSPPSEEVAEVTTAEPTEAVEQSTVEPAGEWQPAEPYRDKIVPIISALEGTRIGIARVNGPQSAVNRVQAVVQLETHYKKALEIDVYVPISTKVPGRTLARVQGVGVTGLGDLQL